MSTLPTTGERSSAASISAGDLSLIANNQTPRPEQATALATEPPDTAPTILAYTLRLRKIRFDAHIGVSPEERAVPQELLVDVDLSFSVDDLPELDALEEAVDYDGAVRRVVEEGTGSSYLLLETYAKHVVARLLGDLPVSKVRVAVTKRHVPTRYPVAEAIVELVGTRSPVAAPALRACSKARAGLRSTRPR